MFTATRVAAGVAILALAGSLAIIADPVSEPSVAPAAQSTLDPADFGGFSGIMVCGQGTYGEITPTDWGSITIGEKYPRCAIEVGDPRISGNSYSVHDYHKYDGQPRWGVRSYGSVITNEDGTWVTTDGWGYQQPEDGTMLYAARYRGTGAYEGLSALMILSQDTWGFTFDAEGVIIPGAFPDDLEPPIEAASSPD